MSRKTMDEMCHRTGAVPDRLYNIWKVPGTMYQQNDDERAEGLIDGKLTDEPVVRAYQRAWDPGHHLDDAREDYRDALWGVNEGKRDVRNYYKR